MTEQIQQRPGERIFIWLLLAFGIFVLIAALMIPPAYPAPSPAGKR